MTEKEKMAQGLLYDANYDEALIKERERAKDLCFKYNQTLPSDTENQQALLHELICKIKKNLCITAPFWCDYGYNIITSRLEKISILTIIL